MTQGYPDNIRYESAILTVDASVAANEQTAAVEYAIPAGFIAKKFGIIKLNDNSVNDTQFKIELGNGNVYINNVNVDLFEVSSNLQIGEHRLHTVDAGGFASQTLKLYLKNRTATGVGETIKMEFVFKLEKV